MFKFFLFFLLTSIIVLFIDFHRNVSQVGPPISLMIQLSTWQWGPSALTDWMNYICKYHRAPNGTNQMISNLILMDIALVDRTAGSFKVPPDPSTNDTLLTNLIDALLPYFPGGNGLCQFDNVFVGTLSKETCDPPPGWSIYREGIKTQEFRWNLLLRQRVIAQQLIAHIASSANPNVYYHWYISQEGMLDYMTEFEVANCYLAYLEQHMIDLNNITSGRAFLWSPGFEGDPYNFPANSPQMNNLTYSLNFLFKSLIKNVSPFLSYGNDSNGPLWLAMQDHVGALWCAPQQITKEKAAIWFNFLKQFPFRSLLMNVELYKFDCSTGAIYPADLAEVQAREAYYMGQGIPLGPSFELRFWGAYSYN